VKRGFVHLAFGTLFGFVLARNGAADFDAMYEMFLFRDFHLFGVAIVSTGLTIAGFSWLRRTRSSSAAGSLIRWPKRPVHRGSILGAVIFGVGWGVSGACPGTALVQVGQGHLIALSTVVGIVVGTAAYDPLIRRVLKWPRVSCE
jgi:uncharacterized membrane protein YedE/YeeE